MLPLKIFVTSCDVVPVILLNHNMRAETRQSKKRMGLLH